MAFDLTPATRAEMMIDRLTLPDGTTVKFIKNNGSGWVTILELDGNDDWSVTEIENLYINLDFVRLLVIDFTGFEDILAQTEAIFLRGRKYKIERTHSPISYPLVWSFKLEPLDDWTKVAP
jgi:hypothetical protein